VLTINQKLLYAQNAILIYATNVIVNLILKVVIKPFKNKLKIGKMHQIFKNVKNVKV